MITSLQSIVCGVSACNSLNFAGSADPLAVGSSFRVAMSVLNLYQLNEVVSASNFGGFLFWCQTAPATEVVEALNVVSVLNHRQRNPVLFGIEIIPQHIGSAAFSRWGFSNHVREEV